MKLYDVWPLIAADRVVLKKTEMKDHLYLSDLFEHHLTEKYTVMVVRGFERKFAEQASLVLGIHEKESDVLCGVIEAYDRAEDGSVQIGYRMSVPYRGRGYTKEAVRVFTEWLMGFDEVPYIRAYTAKDNTASQKILTSCGFWKAAETEDQILFTYGERDS